MSRRRIDDKKVILTLRIRKSLVDALRQHRGYNRIVEKLIEGFLKKGD